MKRSSVKVSVWVGGSFLILLSALIAFLMPQQSFLGGAGQEFEEFKVVDAQQEEALVIGWKLLQTLDYKKNVVPDELQTKVNAKVRIPGFAVPLGNNFQAIEEFLFVPNQLACIHVPAPPPHLVVYVKLRNPLHVDKLAGPLWTTGLLRIKHTDSMYGAAAYEMDGLQVEPYTYSR